ncbi:dihydrodipicolinate synthase family protein [Paenibacillus koleovorans]|uniref:dihydrodipicolinate synthase family protein n=1 Tax=Paenibacillus koleovorans TaxID=121608 RepID=UPI0013E30338|nr:dihydrodipicolinate synthase family protein [Paenibacillus koleovorans]
MTRLSNDALQGVYALLLTPFEQSGEVDWNGYERHVEWQLSKKPNGLFAVCGTSEMNYLSLEERIQLARAAVQRAGATPVAATVNLNDDLATHLEEMKRMEETGIAAAVLVPPDGMGQDQSRLLEYYAEMASASSIPVLLYEWPMRRNHLLDAETYRELALKHGIRGVKDTTCTREGIEAKIKAAPESVVYQANMAYMLEAIELGAKGIMAIVSAAAADLVIEMWHSAGTDDNRARELHVKLVFLNALLSGTHPMSAKYLAALRGSTMELHCRSLKTPLRAEHKKALDVFQQWAFH